MKRILFVALALVGSLVAAQAQTSPGLFYGQVPTAAQWNAFFAAKQDYLGSPACVTAGCTMTGPLITAPSGTPAAGFNLAPGVAPTSPNNGDVWVTTAGMYVQVNGATVGPLIASGAISIVYGSTTAGTSIGIPYNTSNGGVLNALTPVSGGIIGATSNTTPAYSAALTQYGVVCGGGAGATPTATAAPTAGQLLVGQTSACPAPESVGGDVASLTSGGSFTFTAVNTHITSLANLVTVGTLTSGAIGSGFTAINFTSLATLATSNVLGNFSGSPAAPSAQSVPSCANDGAHGLVNPSGAGFTCGSIVSGVASVTGTSGQITASPTTGAVVLSLPSTLTPNLTLSGSILNTGAAVAIGSMVNGNASLGASSTNGAVLNGLGSTYDFYLSGSSGNICYVFDGTVTLNCGTLIAAGQISSNNSGGIGFYHIATNTGTASEQFSNQSTGASAKLIVELGNSNSTTQATLTLNGHGNSGGNGIDTLTISDAAGIWLQGGPITVSGVSFGLAGNISASGIIGTSGIRYRNVGATLTDTSSSGTIATAYTDVWGGNTIASSNATTITNYYGAYFNTPIAGTNVTLTNKYALGADTFNATTIYQGGVAIGTGPFLPLAGGTLTGALTTITGSSTAPAVIIGGSVGFYVTGGNFAWTNGTSILAYLVSGGSFVNAYGGYTAGTAGVIGWTSGANLISDAANIMAQVSGTNANTFRVYNTSSSSNANFRRLDLDAGKITTGMATVAADNGGTGVAMGLQFGVALTTGGGITNIANFSTAGHLLWNADATYNIGASGANRPENIYAANVIDGAGGFSVNGTAGANCSAGTVISSITVIKGIVTAITGTGC